MVIQSMVLMDSQMVRTPSGGVELQESGYVLRSSRVGLGSQPPATGTFNALLNQYPMGSFVEDYDYQPPAVSDILLTTDAGLDLTDGSGIRHQHRL